MFRRILLSAVGAGIAAGLLTAALQHVTITPLIIAAEAYEDAGGHGHAGLAGDDAGGRVILADASGGAAAEPWAPEDGLERTLYTSLATVLTGIGFALMLLAAMVVKGGRIDARTGLLWGLGGFAALSLAPALGLPPELPGSAAADIVERQLWWVATAAASAGGLGLLAFSRRWGARAAGIAILAAPHLIGAPHPHAFSSTAPAELAGHFAAASLVVGAVFWALIGLGSGALFERLAPDRGTPA